MARPVPNTAEVSNPDSWDSKKNKLRVFAMHVLNALGIELRGLRMKNVADAFVPQEENTAANASHIQQEFVDESARIVPPELDLLDKLFGLIKDVVNKVMSAVRGAAHESVTNAQMSGVATRIAHAAVDDTYTVELVEAAARHANQPAPSITEEELTEVHEDLRDEVRTADREYQELVTQEEEVETEAPRKEDIMEAAMRREAAARYLKSVSRQHRNDANCGTSEIKEILGLFREMNRQLSREATITIYKEASQVSHAFYAQNYQHLPSFSVTTGPAFGSGKALDREDIDSLTQLLSMRGMSS